MTQEPESEPVSGTSPGRHRGPLYPSIGLERAVDFAKRLYAAAKRNSLSPDQVARAWEMSPTSGTLKTTLSAVIKYGLIDEEGKGDARKLRLSDSGIRLAVYDAPEHAVERAALLRAAALAPSIHRELTEHFRDGLPSDPLLRSHLLVEHKFHPDHVDGFVGRLRATLAYAGVDGSAATGAAEEVREAERSLPPPAAPPVEKPPATTPPLATGASGGRHFYANDTGRSDDVGARIEAVDAESGIKIVLVLPQGAGMKVLRRVMELGATLDEAHGIKFPD